MPPTETRELTDPARQHAARSGPRPVRLHLWRPAGTRDPRPTVLVSHGTGGSAGQMDWLAEPLARAGFLVAAVDHHGNNHVDGYLATQFAALWERARDLSFVLDHLARGNELGPVGAAGFSAGGYTAAALLGARISEERYRAMLDLKVPVPEVPEYPGLIGEIRRLPDAVLHSWPMTAAADYSDWRVECAFLICPGAGPLIDENSLERINRPVAVRWGDADDVTVPEENARHYARFIPGTDARSVGFDVAHYDFLGSEPRGGKIRVEVASEAVAFFTRHVGAPFP
ncbi:alpha/beta hydrolase family protein [Nocardiopsis ansamitocini]|uniref:Serine aminopeptidase S33 domain-containing protein n=1 Tax=Nocardiopsis ansamitocini TaxID=1670832 RepID=A0A9W6UIV8_9ACTN|nr:alpha/beta hydrolase [Nocardiopsis ansamitocini]GLU47435.1 hypothetical protein Nans01_17860 [Nocardiopsis ansamitocini]